jgi:hypothetical protein
MTTFEINGKEITTEFLHMDEAAKRLRKALKQITGKTWSVKQGKGTSSCITVTAPPSRLISHIENPNYDFNNMDWYYRQENKSYIEYSALEMVNGKLVRSKNQCYVCEEDALELGEMFGRDWEDSHLVSPDSRAYWVYYLENYKAIKAEAKVIEEAEEKAYKEWAAKRDADAKLWEETQLQKNIDKTKQLNQAIEGCKNGSVKIEDLDDLLHEVSMTNLHFCIDTEEKQNIVTSLEEAKAKAKQIVDTITYTEKEMKTASGKIAIKRITLGSDGKYGVNIFKTVKEVDQLLMKMAIDQKNEKRDGCIKTSFTIEYLDGTVYNGKLSTNAKYEDTDISMHIVEFLMYAIEKPSWQDEDEYLKIVSNWGAKTKEQMDKDAAENKAFLDNYSLADEPMMVEQNNKPVQIEKPKTNNKKLVVIQKRYNPTLQQMPVLTGLISGRLG